MPANSGPEERLSQRLGRGATLAAVVLVVSGVALLLIYELLPILKLLAIALLLALALRTIVRGLDRRGSPPGSLRSYCCWGSGPSAPSCGW